MKRPASASRSVPPKMNPEHFGRKVLCVGALAAAAYFALFAWIEHGRNRRGPWEVTFTRHTNGLPCLEISQPALGVHDVRIVFPEGAVSNVPALPVKRVFGDSGASRTDYAGQSMKASEIGTSPANKILLGDWIWHYNRGWLDPKSGWHNFKGKSLAVMLFGDGHAVGYRFPTKPESDPFWSAAPNPNNEWW